MNATIKVTGPLLDRVRADLHRPHAFAYERVGFLLAGASPIGRNLLLTVRGYAPVADEDYEAAHNVGAQIGADAMRKAVQAAYRPRSALLHIHTHGGRGVPRFSQVDLNSAKAFVPGFFQSIPRMPHGLLVLSDTGAAGLLWLSPNSQPITVSRFDRVDRPLTHHWSPQHELA
jgi:hypothetical protein